MSQSGHSQPLRQSDVPKVNANLLTSLGYLRPLELDGVSLACTRIHLGKGIYPAGRQVALHRHDLLQIEYALNGTYLFSDGRNNVSLDSTQCLVVPPGVVHRWTCTRPGILLGAELQISGAAARGFLKDMNAAVNGSLKRIRDQRVTDWAGQIVHIALQPVPYAWRRAMIASLLYLWFAVVLKLTMSIEPWRQAVPYSRQTAGGRRRLLVRHALDFMHANYTMPIKLKDIADHLGITPRHLTRLFREYGQQSVNANLLRIRLERARDRLASSASCSVKEIAFACGFSSPSYFTQCFKKAFGRLPGGIADVPSRPGGAD